MLLRSFLMAVVLSTAANAEPPDYYYQAPPTVYERKGNRLIFGGVNNPHRITHSEVPLGYEINVHNALTPVDADVATYQFDIPGGEVVLIYTIGASDTPDTVTVSVPNGWIAIPFELSIEEHQDATILITPYLAG